MTLDLGHFRELFTTAGGADDMPIPKEWLAVMQGTMIGAGASWRFYFNETRFKKDSGVSPNMKLCTRIAGWSCFLVASALFSVIVWGLLAGVNSPMDYSDSTLRTDAYALHVFVLVWIGYPIVAVMQYLFLELGGWYGDDYSPNVSVFKDLSYGLLDTTSKAGLAIYCASRAYWCDSVCEAAL